MMKQRAAWAAVAAYGLVAVVWALGRYAGVPVPEQALLWLRWAALVALLAYALARRSLTTWIFVCMMLGAELGHDAPAVALSLRVLSLVFLRLIKTIIAPLLFATLVSGIAGHADLKAGGADGSEGHCVL